jgi:hypothetical protein
MLLMPQQVFAACGDVTESCGNGVDDDCDGQTDEGCGTCSSSVANPEIPYQFNSDAELRNQVGSSNPVLYGNHVEYRWRWSASHRVTACSMWFDEFDTEAFYDILNVAGVDHSGPLGPNWTTAFAVTTAPLDMRWSRTAQSRAPGSRRRNWRARATTAVERPYTTQSPPTRGSTVCCYTQVTARSSRCWCLPIGAPS